LADVPFCCFTFLCVGAADLEHTAAQAQSEGGGEGSDERDERRGFTKITLLMSQRDDYDLFVVAAWVWTWLSAPGHLAQRAKHG
jgi:hypothetical protein